MNFPYIIDFIRSLYPDRDFIPLHEPHFGGNEKKYLEDCIDSTFVSSVGKYVDRFEEMIREFTGAKRAVATVNGTAALHIALLLAGVRRNDLVITQPLTFIATCNAISYCGAEPVFIDIDKQTLGLSADALEAWLAANSVLEGESCYHIGSRQRLAACVPMHTFGHPCQIDRIVEICERYYIPVVEDSAESIGSYYKGRHTGTFGKLGIFSFNGNKTITTGGGGMIITDDDELGKLAKHITTTAKVPHPWEFVHDMTGYNYRLPNVNAALGCAQMEQLPQILANKRETARLYQEFFAGMDGVTYIPEPRDCVSNYWLNVVLMWDRKIRDDFLKQSNTSKVMTRPAWTLMNKLSMFSKAIAGSLEISEDIESCLVNIPSSVRK
ncbi:MAG TPA: LegC family aminotransferase [Candidatus Syntrophosphaera sp.]|nr:LegC family aminotransferase [Candidatus Syntrophosphaera sp.]